MTTLCRLIGVENVSDGVVVPIEFRRLLFIIGDLKDDGELLAVAASAT